MTWHDDRGNKADTSFDFCAQSQSSNMIEKDAKGSTACSLSTWPKSKVSPFLPIVLRIVVLIMFLRIGRIPILIAAIVCHVQLQHDGNESGGNMEVEYLRY